MKVWIKDHSDREDATDFNTSQWPDVIAADLAKHTYNQEPFGAMVVCVEDDDGSVLEFDIEVREEPMFVAHPRKL